MDQVMNDAGMIWVLFPQLFQDRSCLKLLRQGRVIGRGITDCQNRESVEGLRFEIIRVLRKYDPSLTPLPLAARAALARVDSERAYAEPRLELLHEPR